MSLVLSLAVGLPLALLARRVRWAWELRAGQPGGY